MTDLPRVQAPEQMIHLGLGQPSRGLLPGGLLERASAELFARQDESFLPYGPARGNPGVRERLAGFLSDQVAVAPDQLMITNGNSQALDMICTLFTRPGDTILVEAPTYFLALRIFSDHGLTMIPVPTDENGLVPGALEEILKTCSPAFLYTIPFYHNPSAVTLSAERQEAVARISGTHGLPVVSDEVYRFLYFDQPPPPSLGRFHSQCPVLSLGSFSKILAPGLRLGWIHTSPETLKKITGSGLLRSGGGVNPFTSAIVDRVVRNGSLAAHIAELRDAYRRRAAVLCRELREALPRSVSFTPPRGGYFVWLRFPEGVDCKALRKTVQKNGVDFYPGSYFSPDRGFASYMRLSFAMYDEAELAEGVTRLGRALKQALPGLYKGSR